MLQDRSSEGRLFGIAHRPAYGPLPGHSPMFQCICPQGSMGPLVCLSGKHHLPQPQQGTPYPQLSERSGSRRGLEDPQGGSLLPPRWMANGKGLAMLRSPPSSAPPTRIRFRPSPGSRQGSSWGAGPCHLGLSEGASVASVAHRPGPMVGRRPLPSCTPAHAVCPCLLSAAPARRGACTTLPAAPLPPPRSLETCPFCFSILPLAVHCGGGVRAAEAEGLAGACSPLSVSACLRAPGHLPPGPTWPQRPPPRLPLHSLRDWQFWGRTFFVCFSAKQQQQSIELL